MYGRQTTPTLCLIYNCVNVTTILGSWIPDRSISGTRIYKLTKRKHVVLAMQAMHSEPMASIAGIARTLTH